MATPFYARLKTYYEKVAAVLRGQADAASIFPNSTDVGMSRERVYCEFLRQHAPSKCNIFFGGFLFDEDGKESNQMDILITTDTAPKFDFHNPDGAGKSFSPVEGTLGVVSIKSTLDQKELYNALDGIASVPPTRSLTGRVNMLLEIKNYDDWPFKVIYASKGISGPTIQAHVNRYYQANPHIPPGRRPNIIHVAGQYTLFKTDASSAAFDPITGRETPIAPNTYFLTETQSDIQAISWTLAGLQERASASAHILFTYAHLIRNMIF
jgi:hypothetical protein